MLLTEEFKKKLDELELRNRWFCTSYRYKLGERRSHWKAWRLTAGAQLSQRKSVDALAAGGSPKILAGNQILIQFDNLI